MNLQQLRYVRALAEFGSFVDAAKRCGVTQPTLGEPDGASDAERLHLFSAERIVQDGRQRSHSAIPSCQ
jgi:regulatory helix-turn-helix LysR family protein